jgi:MtfA peptidase
MSDFLDHFFAWLPALEPRAHKRERLMETPFPAHWRTILHAQVPFWRNWSEELQAEAEPMIQAFAGEHRMKGVKGLTLTEEMQVIISASAVRPVLRLGLEHYDHISAIVVYPYDRLVVPGHGDQVLGVAHTHGVVVLSWPAVLRGLAHAHDGHDTALHEFVHILDLANGSMNGEPALRHPNDLLPWAATLGRRFEAMQAGAPSPLRDYAAVSPAEFLAVASEYFFERPRVLKRRMPDLYAQLERFYGWDPAA